MVVLGVFLPQLQNRILMCTLMMDIHWFAALMIGSMRQRVCAVLGPAATGVATAGGVQPERWHNATHRQHRPW